MNLPSLSRVVSMTTLASCLVAVGTPAQTIAPRRSPAEKPVITLDPLPEPEQQAQNFDSKGHLLAPAPADFRRFGEATLGQPSDIHTLTLRFAEQATLTGISSTADFPVQGGTCVTDNTYQRGSTCTVLVRFTPKGPGNRLGRLTVAHTSPQSGSENWLNIGLGGSGYAPVLSFIPSVIYTVPGTFPSGAGLLSGASNLATDGGDRLFIADTDNKMIRMMDSTNSLFNYSSPNSIPPPLGITVDIYGDVWFTDTADSGLFEITNTLLGSEFAGTSTDACTYGTPVCTLVGETLYTPGELSADVYGNIFFSERSDGAAMSSASAPFNFLRLNSFWAHLSGRFATDPYQNLYSFIYGDGPGVGRCEIGAQTISAAEGNNVPYRGVAGTTVCGFSGDSGDARNAEIGSDLGQFAFDVAGNLYFTDRANQRVRRIDYSTGVIQTVAGNGTAGYAGDGGPATSARLNSPSGLAVDSQGQLYIISGDGNGGASQVVRYVSNVGELAFRNQGRGSSSAAQIVMVSNTGNAPMVLTAFGIAGPNPADFAVDPLTTSCPLSGGATLTDGKSCTIGVIFTPSSAGQRSAKLVFTDNTVANINTVLLSGTGILPVPTISITSPSQGQQFQAGTAIPATATVNDASSGFPTGTVQFQVDGANTGSPVRLLSGAASTNLSGLTAASHTIGAIYSGDSNYGAAGPVTVSISVTATLAATKVSLAPLMAANGAAAVSEFSVSVAADNGSMPTGQVQLKDGSRLIGMGSLANGHTVIQTLPLPQGVHPLIAVYVGDSLHSPAASPMVLEVVTSGQRTVPPPGTRP